jgi:hypothetical protein
LDKRKILGMNESGNMRAASCKLQATSYKLFRIRRWRRVFEPRRREGHKGSQRFIRSTETRSILFFSPKAIRMQRSSNLTSNIKPPTFNYSSGLQLAACSFSLTSVLSASPSQSSYRLHSGYQIRNRR